MAMAIQLSESQMPRPLPPPTFSAPFAAPSLRWVCKKRLRCFNPDASAALRLPCTADDRGLPASQLDLAKPLQRATAARSTSVPPRSPPCSDRTESPMRMIPASRREEDVREEPPDPSSVARDVGELRSGGEPVGWSLRSRMRGRDGMGSENKTTTTTKKRKVELWLSLSRDEIEWDFLSMTGSKPRRRHRRGGGGAASNHLLKESGGFLSQGIFPGSCLPTFLTADRYKVPEDSDPRKR